MKYVIFKISEEIFGIDIQSAVSIEKISPITRVPLAPSYLLGIINLRGEIIPVIDLSRALDQMPERDIVDFKNIVIVKRDDYKIGLLTESDVSIIELDNTAIQRDLSTLSEKDRTYISGVARHEGQIVNILDVVRLTTPERAVMG